MYSGTVFFMDQHSMASQLPESRVHRQRYRIDHALRIIVGLRWVTHLADITSQHERRGNHALIAKPVLGVGNATVITQKPVVIAGEAQTDGIAMGHVYGISHLFSSGGVSFGAGRINKNLDRKN